MVISTGGHRVRVYSQRSTLAIDQYHPLYPLPVLHWPEFGASLFARERLPPASIELVVKGPPQAEEHTCVFPRAEPRPTDDKNLLS